MKIVAFLQNMWVRDPVKTRQAFDRYTTGRLREAFIAHALFSGCVTGRRLRHAFGDLCDVIVWEEPSPVIADNPRDYFPPDPKHVAAVLRKHGPDIVLCFSRRAELDIFNLLPKGCSFVSCPHPAARGAHVIADLDAAALRLRNLMLF